MCLLRHVVVAAAELNDEASSLKAHYVRSYLHWAVIEDNEYNSMINVKVFKKADCTKDWFFRIFSKLLYLHCYIYTEI